MHSRARILAVSLIFLLALVAIAVRPGGAAAASGEISGSLPTTGGIGLAVWGGGSVDVFQTAASARGCSVSAAWVTSASSTSGFIGYVRGAPAVVNADFNAAFPSGIPATTVLIVLCGAGTPSAAATAAAAGPTTASNATATPTSTPPAGAPSNLIIVSGDLLPDSATTVAMNITKINTLPAVTLPRENSEVTYVKFCRWSSAADATCTNEVPPPLDLFREAGTSYIASLPAAGGRVTLATQLCNTRGCADPVFWGTAGMARDGSFSFIATTYGSGNRIRPWVNTPSITRMSVTYSDGRIGFDTPCARVAVCATGSVDPSPLARGATISSIAIDGSVLNSETVILRGSQSARTNQRPDPQPRLRNPGLSADSPVTPSGQSDRTVNDGRLSFAVTASQSLAIPDARTFSEVSATLPNGSGLKLTIDGGTLVKGVSVSLGIAADLAALATQAPPPPGSEFVLCINSTAMAASGETARVAVPQQIRAVFTLPSRNMAADTVADDLYLAYWSGNNWVTASDGTLLSNGSFFVDSWWSRVGTYAVFRRVPA